jgi:hypothetical protein
MIGFKLNSKGMKEEGYKLESGHKRFLENILVKHPNWCFDMGYGDTEYIQLNGIFREGRYFEWDKEVLNDMRKKYLSYPPFTYEGLPF